MSSFTRSELPSILFRGDGDLPRGQGILAEAAFLQEQVGGESLLVLEHEVADLPFGFEGWAADQISLFEGWGELHPLFLSVCSLPSFEKVKETIRTEIIFFLLSREKGSLYLPTKG